MRLPAEAHTTSPWGIHGVVPDFRLYDVWALPTPGGPADFPRLKEQFLGGDTANNPSFVARTLFAIRWRLGELFGWDDEDSAVGGRVTSLRERLPEDLRDLPVTDPTTLPFTTVFETEDEWAAEMANRTVHCVMHIGWVPDPTAAGGFRGQMAVLVKPNGRWGKAYMAAIAPFRHLLVYPPLMREIADAWENGVPPDVEAHCGPTHIPDAVRVRLRTTTTDYVDTTSLLAHSDRPASWWARTMFEDLVGTAGRELVFRVILGLRRESGPSTVAGWRVVDSTPSAVTLTSSGRRMACEMHLITTDEAVHLALAVRSRTAPGAAIWSLVAPIHRRFGAALLKQAWKLESSDTLIAGDVRSST